MKPTRRVWLLSMAVIVLAGLVASQKIVQADMPKPSRVLDVNTPPANRSQECGSGLVTTLDGSQMCAQL